MAAERWIVGADHAGLELKNYLVNVLRRLGDDVEDLGTHSADSVDYPDYAAEVAQRVVTGAFTARATRAHNDANIMTVGQRVIGAGVAEEALKAFRETAFEGGRHQ